MNNQDVYQDYESCIKYEEQASTTQVGGSHYRDMKIQPIDFIYENSIPYMEANVIKYVCRHASKNGLQDLQKAKHYIDLIIEKQYKTK